jgi:hypothetical protein
VGHFDARLKISLGGRQDTFSAALIFMRMYTLESGRSPTCTGSERQDARGNLDNNKMGRPCWIGLADASDFGCRLVLYLSLRQWLQWKWVSNSAATLPSIRVAIVRTKEVEN